MRMTPAFLVTLILQGALMAATPKLLLVSHFGVETSAPTVLQNLAWIESLPVDGVCIQTSFSFPTEPGPNASAPSVFSTDPVSYAAVYNELRVLLGKFTKVKYNFVPIGVDKPCDFFSKDYDVIVQNWANFAKAARDAGMTGIIYDNEEYNRDLWNYPDDVDSSSKYTLDQYRTQVRLRGRQCMQAVMDQWPNAVVLVFHGPYVSEPNKPSWLTRNQISGWTQYELLGPFYVGMAGAKTDQAVLVDGGEVYQYRTRSELENSYQWRKTTIASASNNSPNIPAALRPQWAAKNSISFGLYNRSWPDAQADLMNPAIMGTCVEYAMTRCDDWTWIWTEGASWYNSGTPSQDWLTAIRQGRQDAIAKRQASSVSRETVRGASASRGGAHNRTSGSLLDGRLCRGSSSTGDKAGAVHRIIAR